MSESPSINDQILHYELNCQDWEYQHKAEFFDIWFDRIKVELDLNLPKTHIRIEQIHPRALGTYNFDRNGIGVNHEITLNTLHFDRPEWDLVRTIAHECTHFWEDIQGLRAKYRCSNRAFHSKHFIEKADALGYPVTKWGQSLGIKKDSPFHLMLQKYGVDLSGIIYYNEAEPVVERRGPAKTFRTHPWKCSCNPPVYAWTAEKEFLATCGRCKGSFVKVSRNEKITFTPRKG